MKGVLDFLEKAGLVTKDAPMQKTAMAEAGTFGDPVDSWLPPAKRPEPASVPRAASPLKSAPANEVSTPPQASSASSASAASPSPIPPAIAAEPLKLEQIYADEGVPPSQYPAERLLRLVEGLSAMDENTRHMAIRAMDAADESWTIADPLADAGAKVKALAAHAGLLRESLQQLEAETAQRLAASAAKQDEAVNTIRKQIADMESLLARETARGAQENAALEAGLQAARDQASRQLAEVDAVSQRLQSLTTQFSALAAPAQE
ncbi:MAG: methyl-accepting chemotaxis protein [Comamonadaceae bacterium]|nr:MAG: methyl-accepting chemotaxis protein [Comamonadaceae bacterium]